MANLHAPLDPDVNPKYGRPLTGSDWVGFPMRVGKFPGNGYTEDLTGESDGVLIWTGGMSQVRINCSCAGETARHQHDFRRVSGCVDLLPKGIKLHSVAWEGEPTTCTSVNLPEPSVTQLTDAQPIGLGQKPVFRLVDAHIVDLVHRLWRQASGEEPLDAVYVQSTSLSLLTYVSSQYGQAPKNAPAQGPLTPVQRRKITDFIEDELGSNFGLVDMSALIGCSPDHFVRLFKRTFSVTPHQYVISRRVERAKAMLHDRSHAIASVALRCGFANQAHFSDAFKKRTGLTPSGYRKQVA